MLIVIGRGPSIARLQLDDLDGVVMAINQTIEQVEALHPSQPLYSLQKDHFYCLPKHATLLLHDVEALREIDDLKYEHVYSFNVRRDFGINWSLPSVVIAEKFANLFGCEKVRYLCCDAVTDGITEAYGHPATKSDDYLVHGAMVTVHAVLPVEWMRI